jgi:hypothetical protein
MRDTIDSLQNRVNTALLSGDWATLTGVRAYDGAGVRCDLVEVQYTATS